VRLLTIILLIMSSPVLVFAGQIRCHRPYTMVLDGTSNVFGVRQVEHMELEKVRKRGGINGRWKVTAWTIRYPPNRMNYNFSMRGRSFSFSRKYQGSYTQVEEVDLGQGMSMKMRITIKDGEMISEMIQSNFYLDVVNNRIGLKKTNLWIGRIDGNRVTLQFFQPRKLQKRGYAFKSPIASTLLKGHVYLRSRREGRIEIISPAGDDRDVVFDRNNPALAVIKAEARVSPGDLQGAVKWRFDRIQGSQIKVEPLPGNRANIYIKNLPPYNNQFGNHTLRVFFSSSDGQCKGRDTLRVRLFYPAFARNNPGSTESSSLPNWFYYWRQTPAARPGGQRIVLEYGDRNRCNCNQSGIVACYETFSFNKRLYLCDLSRPEFRGVFQITFPLLDRTKSPPLLGWRTTRYIDTFAVSIIHEYQHYIDEINWVDRTTKRVPGDRDGDWIPDDIEPRLGFDPTRFQTFKPMYRENGTLKPLDVGGDEEWIAYEKMREYVPGTYRKYDWGCPGSQIQPDKCR